MTFFNNTRATKSHQHGAYIVFMVFFVVAAITLCGMVIGSGILSVNRARYGTAVNYAALAVLERFVRGNEADYLERANAARDRANSVVFNADYVSLFGMRGSPDLGVLDFGPPAGGGGSGGLITFGVWKTEGEGDCREGKSDYPCFVARGEDNPPHEGEVPEINAVRVKARTPNPFKLPFGFFIGREDFNVGFEAIAAVVPRRVVFAVDAGNTSFRESHKGYQEGDAIAAPISGTPPSQLPCRPGASYDALPRKYICPRGAAMFAYSNAHIPVNPIFGNWSICKYPVDSYVYMTNEGRIWCNMVWINGGEAASHGQVYRCRLNAGGNESNFKPCVDPPNPPDPDIGSYTNQEIPLTNGGIEHYANDYESFKNVPFYKIGSATKVYKDLWVDVWEPPLPMADFLGAINSVAQMLASQRSLSDKVKLMGFKAGIFDSYPALGKGFTDKLDFIMQLSNVNNIRRDARGEGLGPIEPNFVRRGYVSFWDDPIAGSNMVEAIEKALDELADTEFSPINSRKVIIVATDGIMNCSRATGQWICGESWENYKYSEQYLLQHGSLPGRPGEDSLMERLQRAMVSVTILHAGDHVGPNFINRKDAAGKWLNYATAQAQGYGGLPEALGGDRNKWFVNPESSAPCGSECMCGEPPGPCGDGVDEYAFYHAGEEGVVFRRAAGVLAEFAMKTGGIYVPLQRELYYAPGHSGEHEYCYEDDPPRLLKDACRDIIGEGNLITWLPEYISGVSPEAQRAAFAAVSSQRAVGHNPFILVKEY